MPIIRQLSPEIVAKIAAGEVIERPAYAVKELIENSLDAKATAIEIHIEDSGLKRIQVVDNGEGMSEEDLKESYKPHTTSKLHGDSFLGIQSLGFRGEALASLAAVSTLAIKSKVEENPAGVMIEVKNGLLVRTSPVGMPQGTVVIADNLFANVPARKKFLKSAQTEFRHIVEIINTFALSYPNTSFRLTHNKRQVLQLLPAKGTSERIEAILGNEIFTQLLPITFEDSYLSITGFVGKPQLSSSSTTKQFIFVNGRRVADRLISLAVKEAFGTMLEATSYPIFTFFLTIPFEMIDVNVHPRKEQVSFVNTQMIFQAIKEAVSTTLQENNLTFQNLSWKKRGAGLTNSFAGRILRENILNKEGLAITKKVPVTQLYNVYLLAQAKTGILLIDQHAAHERVLFEKLKSEFTYQKNKTSAFRLPKPIKLFFPKAEILLIKEYQKEFRKLGFHFTSFSIDSHSQNEKYSSFTLTQVPSLFQDRNVKELIQNIIEELQEGKPARDIDSISEEMISFLACRAAVKSGDQLEKRQREKILSDLENAPNNATCPHGRPTRVFIFREELDTMFGR